MSFEVLGKIYESIIIALAGKKIAVLGARGAGKSTLLHFLQNESSQPPNEQTTHGERKEKTIYTAADLEVKLKSTFDLPGGEHAINQWKKLHDKSDYVIYLINSKDIEPKRVLSDLQSISSWQNEIEEKPKVIIAVTHMDLNAEYCALKGSNRGEFYDKYITGLAHCTYPLSHSTKICIGALNNETNARELIQRIFRELLNG